MNVMHIHMYASLARLSSHFTWRKMDGIKRLRHMGKSGISNIIRSLL